MLDIKITIWIKIVLNEKEHLLHISDYTVIYFVLSFLK